MKKTVKIVQLVHIQGPFKGEIQEFAEDKITIGRNPSCSLTFPPDLAIVSRNHAEIVREGERFKVIDHSANGTYVNGKRITEAFLKDGDVLTIAQGGPKVSFLTKETDQVVAPPESEQAAVSEAPAPSPPVQAASEASQLPPSRSRAPQPAVSRSQEIMVPLVIQFGPTLRSYKKVPVIMGRHPKCDFQIEEPGIMDRHAEVFFGENQYWIKDLTSRQLVAVNGVPVDLGVPLNTHDEISLTPEGPFFTFLGGGRLAQVEKKTGPAAEQAPSDGPPEQKPAPQPPRKVEKKGRSFFKKVLKR